VLILGGGDGMAVREVLRWADVERVTLVDLDPRVTELFRDRPGLAALNDRSLSDPKVTILNQDAWLFARESAEVFDVIILDLPDPRDFAVSKLYSREFYAPLMERLSPRGVMVTQAGSPVFAREAFWSVVRTWAGTRNPARPGEALTFVPYHTYVPSFGDWGFTMVTQEADFREPASLPEDLKYLSEEAFTAMTVFPEDSGPLDVQPNTILSHPLVRYYEDGWAAWMN
jgi:spermidine synthase